MSHKTIDELKRLTLTGSEQEIRIFIAEHWDEFPEDIQDHISGALFVDALRNDVRKENELDGFQTKILESLEQFIEK